MKPDFSDAAFAQALAADAARADTQNDGTPNGSRGSVHSPPSSVAGAGNGVATSAPERELLTISEAAVELGESRQMVSRRIADGVFAAQIVAGRKMLDADEVRTFAANGKRVPTAAAKGDFERTLQENAMRREREDRDDRERRKLELLEQIATELRLLRSALLATR